MLIQAAMRSNNSKLNWWFLLLTLCVTAVIIHGSLYPYAFYSSDGAAAAIRALLASWRTPPAGFADGVANLCLYMPLGFAGVLTLQHRYRLAGVTFFGLLLCTAIEIAQFFDAGRITNMSDVYLNTIGTAVGGLAGVALDLRLSRAPLPTIDVVPTALIVTLLAYRLYPYVPTIDVHKYWHSVKEVVLHPSISPWPLFHYFVLWLTISYLVSAIVRRSSWLAILCFAAFVFAAKIEIVDQVLGASELIGGALAVSLWFALQQSRFCSVIVFALLAVTIVLVRLQPFDFHSSTVTAFGWIPFRSVVEGSPKESFIAFGEKIFLYGSLIWIGFRARLPLWASTTAAAMLLFITSFAETHIPGRSAEVTDGLMSLIIGVGIAALDRAAPSSTNSQESKPARYALHQTLTPGSQSLK